MVSVCIRKRKKKGGQIHCVSWLEGRDYLTAFVHPPHSVMLANKFATRHSLVRLIVPATAAHRVSHPPYETSKNTPLSWGNLAGSRGGIRTRDLPVTAGCSTAELLSNTYSASNRAVIAYGKIPDSSS